MIKAFAQKLLVRELVRTLPKFSNKNLTKMIKIGRKLAPPQHKEAIDTVMHAFEANHPAVQLAKKLITEMSPNCRDKVAVNLFVNAMLLGTKNRQKFAKKHGFEPPFLYVIDVTSRCNLKCFGCWAAEYSKEPDMPYEVLSNIIKQGKKMGTYFYTLTGGEPFIRKDIIKLLKEHNDCYFQFYTNGTFINEGLAKALAKVGNAALAISLEGFKKETDERRMKGTFEKILRAMKYLKKYGVPLGFSAVPTRYNTKVLVSDKFIEFYIKQGCTFGWYFTYVPVGRKPDVKIMQTPEQRDYCRRRLKKIRDRYPIFLGDFWNDGPFVGGCIAGGRNYLHITNRGDIEPCVFTHISMHNVKNTSLAKALNSPLFKAIRRRHPYDENLLLPCMLIDNPHILRKMAKIPGIKFTDAGDAIKDPKIIKFLDNYSKKMHKLYDPLWEKEYKPKFGKNVSRVIDHIKRMGEIPYREEIVNRYKGKACRACGIHVKKKTVKRKAKGKKKTKKKVKWYVIS